MHYSQFCSAISDILRKNSDPGTQLIRVSLEEVPLDPESLPASAVVSLESPAGFESAPESLEPQPVNRATAAERTITGTKPRISFFVILSHLIIIFA